MKDPVRRIIYGLQVADLPITDQVFQAIIGAVLDEEIFTEVELAHILLVSKPTIKRWVRGRNLPGKIMRIGIFRWLEFELYQLTLKNTKRP